MDDAPAFPAIPAGHDHRILRAGTWAGLVAATGFGILTDAAVRAPTGIALTLGTWLAAGAVLVLVRPRRVVAPFVLAACAVGACFAVRASIVLTGLNLAAATALLCVGVSFARSASRP